jgi:hypothetical protein
MGDGWNITEDNHRLYRLTHWLNEEGAGIYDVAPFYDRSPVECWFQRS